MAPRLLMSLLGRLKIHWIHQAKQQGGQKASEWLWGVIYRLPSTVRRFVTYFLFLGFEMERLGTKGEREGFCALQRECIHTHAPTRISEWGAFSKRSGEKLTWASGAVCVWGLTGPVQEICRLSCIWTKFDFWSFVDKLYYLYFCCWTLC